MATRTNFGGGGFVTPKPLTAMTRMLVRVPSRGPASSLRVAYSNFGSTSAPSNGSFFQEVDGSSAITLTASVEVSSTVGTSPFAAASSNTLIPLFSRGQRSITLAPGGDVEFDDIQYPFAAGQAVYIRTWYSIPSGGSPPTNRSPYAANYEFCNNGYFFVTVGSSTTASTTLTGTISGATLPLMPAGVSLSGSGITGTIYCDSSGNFPTGGGIAASSSINLTTGAYTLNLTTATAPNALYFGGFGNYGSAGTDETMVSVPTDISYVAQNVFGPSVIWGTISPISKIRPFGYCGVGDSITFGAGNQQAGEYGQSWLDYSVNGTAGIAKLAMSGETTAAFVAINYRRFRLARGRFDRVVYAYGTNDLAIGGTFSALQTSTLAALALLAQLLPNGYRDIWIATIIPRVTSATNNTPISSAFLTARNQYNPWIYTLVGTYCAGIVDTCPAIEATPGSQAGNGSGTWSNLSLTFDGIHPSYSGHMAMANLVGVAGSVPSAAFSIPVV